MLAIHLSRMMEIYCRTRKRYGSGFLLGNGLILTARHVLAEPGKTVARTPLDIEVRSVKMTSARLKPVSAKLVWPTDLGELAKAPDIALIQVTEGELMNMPAPNIHVIDAMHDENIGLKSIHKVGAVGFPNFAAKKDRQRDTSEISGTVRLGHGLVMETLEFNDIDFDTRGGQRIDNKVDWHGFSGAALFVSDENDADVIDRLVGVVVTRKEKGVYAFGAVRISALLRDAEAKRILKTGLPGSQYAPGPPAIDKLVCLLDRTDQEDEIIAAYERASPTTGATQECCAKPAIVLLPGAGETRHVPTELAERLCGHTLPKDLHWPLTQAAMRFIYWPSPDSNLDPAVAVGRMRRHLWNALSGEDSVPTNPAEFASLMNSGRPRFFVSDLSSCRYALDNKLADVLREWSRFWAGLVPQDGRVPIHLLFLNADTAAGALLWKKLAQCDHGALVEVLPELSVCQIQDLENWITFVLRRRFPDERDRLVGKVESVLRSYYQQAFYLGDLKTRVLNLVIEDSNG